MIMINFKSYFKIKFINAVVINLSINYKRKQKKSLKANLPIKICLTFE